MLIWILSLLLKGLVVLGVAKVVPGVRLKGFGSAVLVALVYATLSVLFKWLMVFLALPMIILTAGLFMLVINAVLLYVTDKLLESFEIKSKTALALATLGITIGGVGVDFLLKRMF